MRRKLSLIPRAEGLENKELLSVAVAPHAQAVAVKAAAPIYYPALSQKLLKGNYVVTQTYLEKNAVNIGITPDGRHAGIDFGAPAGTHVYAAKGGTVRSTNVSYGLVAVYDGTNTVFYLHMRNIRVSAGMKISAGTYIGDVSNAAPFSMKAHLHVEVRTGPQSSAVGVRSGSSTAALTLDPVSYLR